jgi:hypothetical protein
MVAPARRKAAGVFISTSMETVAFIDFENLKGKIENLKGKIKEVFRSSNKKPPSWREYDFACLLTKSLRGEQPDRKNIYHATLKVHPDTKEKSLKLISELRFLVPGQCAPWPYRWPPSDELRPAVPSRSASDPDTCRRPGL